MGDATGGNDQSRETGPATPGGARPATRVAWARQVLRGPVGGALRTMVVTTAMVWFGTAVLDNPTVAVFGAFGAFAVLGLAGFAGPPWSRTRANILFVLAGAAGIVMAGYVSSAPWVAVATMFVLAFGVRLLAVFGGYLAAGAAPFLVLYLLAVLVPGGAPATPARVAGWVLAGAMSTVASLVLWPDHPRARFRVDLARLLDEVASGVDATLAPSESVRQGYGEGLVRDVEEFSKELASTPFRPAGPTVRDEAFVFMLDQIGQATAIVATVGDSAPIASAEGRALVGAVAESLRETATYLRGGVPVPSPDRLTGARVSHRGWLERAVAAAGTAGERSRLVTTSYPWMTLSHLTGSLLANAALHMGAPIDGMVFDFPPEVPAEGVERRSTLTRARQTLAAHLSRRSPALQNSLRLAIALSLATGLAEGVAFEHGFWVGLGALGVLRTRAVDTGMSVLEAVGGALVGFGITAAVFVAVGTGTRPYALLVPVAVFLAAYASRAASFLAGQAAFTVFVLVLFSMQSSELLKLGEARVEMVAVGGSVSALVALVVWPRGATGALGRALADSLAELAVYLDASVRRFLGDLVVEPGDEQDGSAVAADRKRVDARRRVVSEAFGQVLIERRSTPGNLDPWLPLVSVQGSINFGSSVVAMTVEARGARCTDAKVGTVIRRSLEQVVRRILAQAGFLEDPRSPRPDIAARDWDEARAAVSELDPRAVTGDDRMLVVSTLVILEILAHADAYLQALSRLDPVLTGELMRPWWR